jgi:hypothetical protein
MLGELQRRAATRVTTQESIVHLGSVLNNRSGTAPIKVTDGDLTLSDPLFL